MQSIYESQYIVNTFHAVNADTDEVYEADAEGYITAKAGDRIMFVNPYEEGKSADLNTLVFTTKGTELKAYINPSDTKNYYPLYVPANSQKGVQYMRVDMITMASDCTFYAEGLAG